MCLLVRLKMQKSFFYNTVFADMRDGAMFESENNKMCNDKSYFENLFKSEWSDERYLDIQKVFNSLNLCYTIKSDVDLEDILRLVLVDKNNKTVTLNEISETVYLKYVLFYMMLIINENTPSFFGIHQLGKTFPSNFGKDLIEILLILAKKYNKEIIITTSNNVIIDSITNLYSDLRLFEATINEENCVNIQHIKIKDIAQCSTINKFLKLIGIVK